MGRGIERECEVGTERERASEERGRVSGRRKELFAVICCFDRSSKFAFAFGIMLILAKHLGNFLKLMVNYNTIKLAHCMFTILRKSFIQSHDS